MAVAVLILDTLGQTHQEAANKKTNQQGQQDHTEYPANR
jgi:hypothetical protein